MTTMNEKLIDPTNPQNLEPVPVEPLYPMREETKMDQQNFEYPKPAYQEVNVNTNVQSDPTKINVTLPIIQTTSGDQQNQLLNMQMQQMQMQQMQFQQMMLAQMAQNQKPQVQQIQQIQQVQQTQQAQPQIIIQNNVGTDIPVKAVKPVPFNIAILAFIINLILPGIGTMIGSSYVPEKGKYFTRGVMELLLAVILIGWCLALQSSIDLCSRAK